MSPLLVLIVAVLATTYSGPIVRFAAAPALAIAFWRLALVVPVTFALGAATAPRERAALRVALPLLMASGALLALHFWAWIGSLRYTSVASSVVLVSLRPIFVWGLAAWWLGEHPGRRERWGIVLAVLGAILIGAGDAALSVGALAGDLLALGGAVAVAAYSVIGRRVRATLGVWPYVSVVYLVAALVLAAVAPASGTPLTGYRGRDWAVFGAMAAGPMLIGHTGMNYALKHLRATTVNVAALGEPVGATLIAWLVPMIHEVPPLTALLGGALVVTGIAWSLSEARETNGTGGEAREASDAG